MVAISSITEEIAELKQSRRAVILAHHYQDSEIQELADAVGDSLELARKARDFEGDVIAFCGVWFMAETAKVLNRERIVVVPDRDAGCSLVDSCPVDQLRAWKRKNPGYAIVSYINTSVEVKAESDILCTSRNAVKIVNSIPADQPVLFLPDINLGNYVREQTGRTNMKIWQGACIVMTESGVRHSLEKLAPSKKFHFIPNEQCNCSECPYMRRNTLEKLRDALRDLNPRVELTPDLLDRARLPIERMLAVR
jgi:quinolinate synthase